MFILGNPISCCWFGFPTWESKLLTSVKFKELLCKLNSYHFVTLNHASACLACQDHRFSLQYKTYIWMNRTNEATKGPSFTNRHVIFMSCLTYRINLRYWQLWGTITTASCSSCWWAVGTQWKQDTPWSFLTTWRSIKWQRLGKWGFTLKFSLEFLYTVDCAHLISHGLRNGPMPGCDTSPQVVGQRCPGDPRLNTDYCPCSCLPIRTWQ